MSSQKSTTVRSVDPAAARAALGALQAIAPPLAARAAARLFMSPPRSGKGRLDWSTLGTAVPFTLESPRGETLRGVRVGRGPAVLLVHGWGGRASQLAALAPPLLAAGASVVAFDGPAHGASSGGTTNLPEMAAAVRAVALRFGARAAIGHSFGAAAVAVALHRGLDLDAAVLVAPPRAPAAFLERFSAALGLGARTREALRERLERRVGMRIADLDVPRLVPDLATPALLVHDRGDAEVPWADGAAIAAAWPRARLRLTDGLGHRRILRDAAVVAEAAAFVMERLPRCGCGRLAARAREGAPRCEACLLSLHLRDREGRGASAAA